MTIVRNPEPARHGRSELTNGARASTSLLACALAAAIVTTALGAPALGVPAAITVEGVLTAAGGAPAADGDYAMVIAFYDGAAAKVAAVSVAKPKVAVAGGRFSVGLGLDAGDVAKLGALADAYVGVQVGADPELPRQPLASTPYALHAGSAASVTCTGCIAGDAIGNGAIAAAKVGFNYAASSSKGGPALDLACTGCVGVAEMKFDGDVDLGGNALKAGNGTFSGDVVAKTVTATAFVGDGSKLTGVGVGAGSCAKGEVVVGIANDGKLVCASMASALPADGLDEVSGGLLSNQFVESVASSGAVGIPDNTGATATSILTLPSFGLAQGVTVKVKLANTDLATVSLKLLPPDDKKVGYVLCDPCGDKDAKALETAWSDKVAPKSGDLGAWLGKDAKGTWNLVATDTSFCIKQAPGNAAICDLDNKIDGAIEAWSIEIATLSDKKVQVGGALLFHVSETEPVPCGPTTFGATYANPKDKALYVCNGKDWAAVYLTIPGSKENPVASCKDLQTKVPDAKSGSYWVANGGSPVEVQCDMTTDGGGWTLIADESGVGCGAGFPSGWSDGKATDAKVAGKCTRVHGVWGTGAKIGKTFSALGVAHSALRVEGRYYAIDSWDNEANGAQVWIDGAMKWSAQKVWNSTGSGPGWVTASFTPAPWGNNNGPNGYWEFHKALGAISHTGANVALEFRTGIDQDLSNESFAFSHVMIWVR